MSLAHEEAEVVQAVMNRNPNAHRGWTTVLAVPYGRQQGITGTYGVCLSRFEDQYGTKFATHYIQCDSSGTPKLISGNYFEDFNHDDSAVKALKAAIEDVKDRRGG